MPKPKTPKTAEERKAQTAKALEARRTPEETKNAILEDAKHSIMQGKTMQEIADKHKIGRSTLALWMSQLGQEYETLRQIWIDSKLNDAEEMVDKAPDSLELARAREKLKYAQWLAEMRDKRFIKQQQVTNITLDLTAAITAGRARAGITIDNDE